MVANLTRTTVTWGEVLLYEEQSKKKKRFGATEFSSVFFALPLRNVFFYIPCFCKQQRLHACTVYEV